MSRSSGELVKISFHIEVLEQPLSDQSENKIAPEKNINK